MRISQITSAALTAITLSIFDVGVDGNVLAVAIRTDPGEELASVSRDSEGFPLPKGATGRLGSMRFWQKGPVNSLFFLPRGRQAVSTEEDCIILVTSALTVAYSPDGRVLAAAGKGHTIRKPGRREEAKKH